MTIEVVTAGLGDDAGLVGAAAWSLTGQHTGTTDLPLTDEGRALTQHLRRRMNGERFDRVLTSPLQRAAETCRIAGFAAEAEPRDDLVEWDYGAHEGRTTAVRSSTATTSGSGWKREVRVLELWNDRSHLPGAT